MPRENQEPREKRKEQLNEQDIPKKDSTQRGRLERLLTNN